jgi:hypothetical protein
MVPKVHKPGAHAAMSLIAQSNSLKPHSKAAPQARCTFSHEPNSPQQQPTSLKVKLFWALVTDVLGAGVCEGIQVSGNALGPEAYSPKSLLMCETILLCQAI